MYFFWRLLIYIIFSDLMISTNAIDWKTESYLSDQAIYQRTSNYLFNVLNLPKEKFTGEKEIFKQYKNQLNISGGAQWFEPTYAVAYSLHHGISEEQLKKHVILYHGVKSNSNVKAILNSKLKPGPGQAFQNKPGKNPQKKVPNGIYASQFLNTTLGYVDNRFPIILQIASPSQMITSRKDYIVLQSATPIKVVCAFINVPTRNQLQ